MFVASFCKRKRSGEEIVYGLGIELFVKLLGNTH